MPTIEQLYQGIGQAAITIADDDLAGKLLIYAEVEDGVISADLFYASRRTGKARMRFTPRSLKDLIYELWEQWTQQPGNQEWRAMCYLIDNGKFRIDLTYADGISVDEELSDRRPRVVRKYFGDVPVDYSNP